MSHLFVLMMNKLYYSISEVSKLVDEEQHILRYWEKEFSQLKPRKNRGGNRIFSNKDIKLIKFIKMMVRDEKLSLKGAKEYLNKSYDSIEKTEFEISKNDNSEQKKKQEVTESQNNQVITKSNKELVSLMKEVLTYLKSS